MNVVHILIKYAFTKFCSLLLHCSSFSCLRDHFLHILVLTINNRKSLMECFTVCVYLKYQKLRLMFQDVFPSLSIAVPFLFRIFSSSFNLCMFALKYSDLYISIFHLYKIVSCTRVLVQEYETLFKTQITSKFLVSLRIRYQRILSYAFLTTILFST